MTSRAAGLWAELRKLLLLAEVRVTLGAVAAGVQSPLQVVLRQPVRYLVTRWPWRCLAYLVTGGLLGLAVLTVVVAAVAVGAVGAYVLVGLFLLAALTLIGIPVASLERRRLTLIEGPGATPLPSPHLPVREPGTRAWLRTRWKERATWREFSYAIVLAMLIGPLSVILIAGLVFSVVMLSTPVLAFVIRLGGNPFSAEAMADAGDALPAGLIGLGGTLIGAYVLALLATAQAMLTRALLMPREEEYREQVISLTRSRARLVEAFEAERRRIERDLHDGAQQRLAALSMTLGLARLELSDVPGRGAELVARAAEEAKEAQAELRRLIWGIHPQVLTDRGIGAAVSHLAAVSPVPVSVSMRLPGRLPSPVEAAAYFAVSEALANVTKHSQASRAEVAGEIQDDSLVITVTDDGVGGADPRAGSGLQGLADRLSVLYGKLELFSPVSGPTTLRVEIPCGLAAHCE